MLKVTVPPTARLKRAAWLASLAFGLLTAAGAQPAGPGGIQRGGGQMATRGVSLYLDREQALQDALSGRNRTAVTSMLAEDFQSRTSASPDTLDAEDWLQREWASAPSAGRVRDLSVREVDDLAIVSFLLDRGPIGGAASASWFVVDTWRQSSHRLLSRSTSRVAGVPPRSPRPTGKG